MYKTVVEANREFYAGEYQNYDNIARLQPYFKSYFEKILKNINFKEKDNLTILDIGTGTGFALKTSQSILKHKHLKLFGCDISHEMLSIAKRKIPEATFTTFNGEKLPKYNIKFDIIILCSVLHHIFDPFPLLEQASTLLKKEGTLIILQEPNPLMNKVIYWFRKFFHLLPPSRIQLAEYHQFMTPGIAPNTIKEFLVKNGFKVRVLYTNANLADEVMRRYHLSNRLLVRLLSVLLIFNTRYLCLNFNLLAKKEMAGNL